eukprot:scaffold693_cov200-Alexandrium_tamarense.AAC.5
MAQSRDIQHANQTQPSTISPNRKGRGIDGVRLGEELQKRWPSDLGCCSISNGIACSVKVRVRPERTTMNLLMQRFLPYPTASYAVLKSKFDEDTDGEEHPKKISNI